MKFETLLKKLQAAEAKIYFGEEGPALVIPTKDLAALRPHLEEHREALTLEVVRRIIEADIDITELPTSWWRSPSYSQAHHLANDSYTGGDVIAWCGRPLTGKWHDSTSTAARCASCRKAVRANPPPWFEKAPA